MPLTSIIIATTAVAQILCDDCERECFEIQSRQAEVCTLTQTHARSDSVFFTVKTKDSDVYALTRALQLEWQTYCGLHIAENDAYVAVCLGAEGHAEYHIYPTDYLFSFDYYKLAGGFGDDNLIDIISLSEDGVVTYEAQYYEVPAGLDCQPNEMCTVTKFLDLDFK